MTTPSYTHFTILGREPAVVLDAIKVILVGLAAFVPSLDQEMQVWITAVLIAVFGVIEGLLTRPVVLIAVTDLVHAAGILLIGLGFTTLNDEKLAGLAIITSVLTTLMQRQNVSPAVPELSK